LFPRWLKNIKGSEPIGEGALWWTPEVKKKKRERGSHWQKGDKKSNPKLGGGFRAHKNNVSTKSTPRDVAQQKNKEAY